MVDEAHHAPATTWNAILEHFTARSLLLTATPQRRDRKRLPGKLVYYYPLRQALREGLYQPVEPHILDVPAGATREGNDQMVAAKVVELLAAPEHASSQFLARAATKARAESLAALRERNPENPAWRKYARAAEILHRRHYPDLDEAHAALLALLDDWTERLALPRLSAYGIQRQDFAHIVAHSRGGSMKTNPLTLSDAEITDVLRQRL